MNVKTIEAAMLQRASRQHGVLRVEEAVRLGASRDLLSTRVRSGRLLRPYPGVLVVPGAPATFERLALSAAWSLRSGVVAGGAGARLWGIPGAERADVEIAVPRGRHQPRPFVVTESRDLGPFDVTHLGVIPVTRRERTLVDLAARWTRDRLDRSIEAELLAGNVQLVRLRRAALQVIGRGRAGSVVLRSILDAREDGPPVPASELERVLWGLLGSGRWGPAEPQPPLPGLRERGWADARLLDLPVIVEADGRRWHTRVADFDRDRRRDREAGARGIHTARFTYQEIVETPEDVAEVLDAHLARRTQAA